MTKTETADKELIRVQELVARASASMGGQNKLAAAIGYPKGAISKWTAGMEPCPAKAQAAMAHYAGMHAGEVLMIATVEHERNPQRKEALIRALGKQYAHLGVAAFLASSVSGVMGLVIDTMRRKVKWNSTLVLLS